MRMVSCLLALLCLSSMCEARVSTVTTRKTECAVGDCGRVVKTSTVTRTRTTCGCGCERRCCKCAMGSPTPLK